jgi:hypothetical protein
MIKKTKSLLHNIVPAVVLFGFAAYVAIADPITQNVPFHVQSGGSGSGCPGAYTGYVIMTNSAGSFYITPPANTTNGTLTDISGFPSPYASTAYVLRESDLTTWCDSNSVSFPANNSQSYELTVFVTSTPPPTNGQPLTLQITWH